MKPARILVCGTNYGQTYIEAIQKARGEFELVGILARGSLRSRELARGLGAPLYQNIDNLPMGIDVACAAMGVSGAEAVLGLLKRGIHVLCEHPQRPDFIEAALAAAASGRACFHVNGHFAFLKAASAFIKHCSVLYRSSGPSFIDVMMTDRSSYGALDILRRSMQSFEPADLVLQGHSLPFSVVRGTLATVPVTFQVQPSNQGGEKILADGDPNYLVDHRIGIGYPEGVLTLMSVAGPVIWNSNYSRSSGRELPIWTTIYGQATTTPDLHEQRIGANVEALRSLVKSGQDDTIPAEQDAKHLLDVSFVWQRIGVLISGPPRDR
jgi:thiazolinyl reductase component of yersiniabactin synthetase